jgi:hypothetical protein
MRQSGLRLLMSSFRIVRSASLWGISDANRIVEVRELLKGQDLSFTEIAKVVGERWQVLPAEERETCERQANAAKEKFYTELADYKKTPQYDAYQKYLEDFRTKHSVPTKGQSFSYSSLSVTGLTGSEGKRSKLETETTTSTRSSSHDKYERTASRRFSSVQPEIFATGHQSSEASPPIGPAPLPAGPSFSSKPTSPTSLPLSTLNSPRIGGHYSPISASPRSTMFDAPSTILSRDLRGPADPNFAYQPSTYPHPPQQSASSISPSDPHVSRYQNPVDLSSRRPLRDAARLPPLTHEDTTYSSESGHSGSGYSFTPTLFPGTVLPLNPVKSMRTLPQPVPSIGSSTSPLDRPLVPAPPHPLQSQQPDYRTQGPLAALIRAGELAGRIADDDGMEVEGSP